jgi:uncharacterized heparinase superfamily protein
MTEAPGWGRLYRTVRHLTARQIAARAFLMGRFLLYRRFPQAARIGLGGPARMDGAGLDRVGRWLATRHPGPLSPRQLDLAIGAAARRFTFLNHASTAGAGPIDWQAPDMSRLWQYHLHYADFVAALALGAQRGDDERWSDDALALVEDWIGANPPGRRPGWDPYPLSLRVVNWVIALAALGPRVDEERRGRIAGSLAAQGRFLARHLEWHLGGNHLLKNAKALFILGVALDCPEAEAWRARGRRLLLDEVERQILADGGHVERSPLYHGIVLEDVLDVLALAGATGPPLLSGPELAALGDAARRMTTWLARMRHPDGGLALFNDCVVAGEPEPAALLAYAARVLDCEPSPAGAVALAESGYFVVERGEARGVVDCGAIGPDELPAHAHADTLSFELSWAGRRVVVDAGTAEYALDDLRRYVRSTAAHNTVRVDEVEQSEVWDSFRVGRRARPGRARLATVGEDVVFAGAHDGYARLGVIHHRHIVATDTAWVVVDELRGRGRHRFESYLHLHPDLRLEAGEQAWRVVGERGDLRVRPIGAVTCQEAQGWYCPDWGRATRAPALVFRGEAEAPVTFGYVLTASGADVEVAVDSDATGVTFTGRANGRPLRIRSDRCTFSS